MTLLVLIFWPVVIMGIVKAYELIQYWRGKRTTFRELNR